MASRAWRVSGEVSDREDLLDGRVRVELEGSSEDAGGEASIEAGLGWRRARGEVSLEAADSYLTLLVGDDEVHASAVEGSVAIDPDTAAARIRARFVIEDASGDLGSAGERVNVALVVGPEEWSGEVSLA